MSIYNQKTTTEKLDEWLIEEYGSILIRDFKREDLINFVGWLESQVIIAKKRNKRFEG